MTEIAVRNRKWQANRARHRVIEAMIAAFVVVVAISLSLFTRQEGMRRQRI